MNRITLLSLSGLLAAGVVSATPNQIEIPDWDNAAAFELVASQSAVRDGDRFEVAVLADIAPGYHLYGPQEKPPSATVAEWIAPGTFTPDDPMYPEPIRRDLSGLGEFDLYEGSVAIRIPVDARVRGGDSVAAEVLLRYQLCTDNACSAPTSTTLTVDLPVVGKGTPVTPTHAEVFTSPSP